MFEPRSALSALALVLLLLGPATASARSADADRALRTGESLLEQGLPDAALERFREARRLAPEDVEIHATYIDMMMQEQFVAEVLAEYAERRKANPTADSIYLHGRIRAQMGDFENARADFQAALGKQSDHHWSLEGLAGLALMEGRAKDAIGLYESARAVAPNRVGIHNKLATILARTGDLDGAFASWRRAIEVDPEDHHAYLNWGAMLSRQGEHEAAAEKLELAVAKAPGYPLCHVNLAYVYARLARYSDAVAHFDTALAINPRDSGVSGSRELVAGIASGRWPSTAFSPMAEALEAEGYDPKLAAQKWREVIVLTPGYAPAHTRLGLMLASVQDAEGALAELAAAAKLAPDDSSARYNLGYLLLGMDKVEEALPHLEAAHRLAPGDPDAITGIALVHLAKGDAKAALTWYDKALASSPLDATLWVQKGTTLAAMGDFEAGILAVRKSLELAPGFAAAKAQLVTILREARRFDEALAELASLEKMLPGNPSVAKERANIEAARRADEVGKAGGVRISQILVLEEARARAALGALDGGTDFGKVAREYGQGPEAARSGDVGWVNPAELRAEVASVVKGLAPGQRSGLISVGGKAWLIVQRTQ